MHLLVINSCFKRSIYKHCSKFSKEGRKKQKNVNSHFKKTFLMRNFATNTNVTQCPKN